ncbi:superoxide dismutase family protein [Francisella frigiditurris]|uniref:Superoxide dismutase [Cu-Zn] n=1 Tax=Francisella frigiditurris TaxID=1542390 RepID=A0A1J0KV38_9GAMM|nr:superoxide dismutase family protein [Francisella frigiditurris]APC97494.1 copper/zinc superoxide dismutase family protein [Francisella frigiditurris]
MRKYTFALLLIILSANAFANKGSVNKVEIYNTETNDSIGYIEIEPSKYGVIFIPNLHNVPTGYHGFHLHVNSDCGNKGMNAGGHYDPDSTGKHEGPYANGHLGDLPVLYADNNGNVTSPVLAPRITINDLHNHSLMIHAGGDNYSDSPEKLGGGGARLACGIVK